MFAGRSPFHDLAAEHRGDQHGDQRGELGDALGHALGGDDILQPVPGRQVHDLQNPVHRTPDR